MYEAFFGLSERPFPAAPLTDRYFPAATSEAARLTLDRCIRRGEGAGLLVGAAGLGKTLLCRALAATARSELRVVMLTSGRLDSPRALLQNVLFQLGRPYRGMDEGELRIELHALLGDRKACPECCLLLVDEAHWLKLRVLDEIRSLTNLDDGPVPRVRVVLAGGPLLEEHLSNPRLDSLCQRIVSRCYLEPFERDETIAFIRMQLKMRTPGAGCPFTKDACVAVHRATGGVPRLINQLADHAMVLAFSEQNGKVDARVVEEAWADLQQLPAPWQKNPWMPPTAGDDASTAGVVEFGGLEDDASPPSCPGLAKETVADREERSLPHARDEENMAAVADIECLETTCHAPIAGGSPPASGAPVAVEFRSPFDEAFEEEHPVPTGRCLAFGLLDAVARVDAPAIERATDVRRDTFSTDALTTHEPSVDHAANAGMEAVVPEAETLTVMQLTDLTCGLTTMGPSLLGGSFEDWPWRETHARESETPLSTAPVAAAEPCPPRAAEEEDGPRDHSGSEVASPAKVIAASERFLARGLEAPGTGKRPTLPPEDLAPFVLRPRQFEQLFSQMRRTS